MPIILDREQKTGKKVMYAFGISHADPETMVRNHDIVADAGGNAAVININSIGYGGLPYLRKRSRLVLHAHRNGWDILTRHPGLGLDFSRLPAILAPARGRSVSDQRHRREILGAGRFFRALVRGDQDAVVLAARSPACPSPVPASGAVRRRKPSDARAARRTLLYLCGGGVVSHPGGPAAGVRAVRQAWEAAVADIPLDDLRAEHQRTRPIDRQVRSGRGRRMMPVRAHIHADKNARANV